MEKKMTKLLFAFILVAMLALPLGYVGAEDDGAEPVEEVVETFDIEESGEETRTTFEKVPTAEVLTSYDTSRLFEERMPVGDFSIEDLPESQERTPTLEDAIVHELAYPFDTETETFATRATDQDPANDDQVNGSAISNWGEQVSGTLKHSNVPTLVDDLDWYEIDLHDDAMTNGGATDGLYNITIELTGFSSSDTTLYENSRNEDGTDYANDYFDYMYMIVQYYDPFFVGFSQIGGTQFDYDNGDDNDGVIKEEGNWTYNFITPIRAYGDNDPNGAAGGLTESGFIYIGFRFGFAESQNAPTTRPDYTIDYEFEVSSERWDMDAVANDRLNGTTPLSSRQVMRSVENQQDWYKFSGNNMDQLWNMTFDLTVEDSSAVYYDFGNFLLFHDVWVSLVYLCPNPGEDGIFDTEDDDNGNLWWGALTTVTGLVNVGGPVVNGQWPYDIPRWIHNNWTDIPQDKRFMYVGLIIEPAELIFDGQSFYGPFAALDHNTRFEYSIDVGVVEHEPNIAPVIDDIWIESDYEYVADGTGGNYDTNFKVLVTYMDENDDPPEVINLIFDKDTYAEGIEDISVTPRDPFDDDYTSAEGPGNPPGRVYQFTILGESLTETPNPHTIHVNCTDFVNNGPPLEPGGPGYEIRGAKDSLMFQFEDGITVWDDEPVEKNTNWQGMPELQEDDDETYVPLEGFDGMFKDPENDFRGFQIWDAENEEWVTDLDFIPEDAPEEDVPLLNINITEYEGIWQAVLTPLENQWGDVSVQFRGYDAHTNTTLTTTVFVRKVNDPPTVTEIEIDGVKYAVDNAQPLRPVLHLEEEDLDIKEDVEFEFKIVAENTDNEWEVQELEYSYLRAPQSDDWEDDPDVEYNTGVVTFTPTNNDVKADNSKMVFQIDDHGENGDIKFEVYFEIENVNDLPTIMIPSTTARTWKQFSKISIRPIASDEDKNDQITFSTNFDEAIGDEYDSVLDQLPFAEISQGIDWEINPTTGDFWFQLDDQNIWKTSNGMEETIEIVLIFKATDSEGGEATTSITLILSDENEPPEEPDIINANPTKPEVMEIVNFWVDPLSDPDMDKLTYRWDFGDGSSGEGINVNHTYTTKGWKSVQMWAEDGQFQTEKIILRIEVVEAADDDDDDTTVIDDDDDDTVDAGDDNTMFYAALGIIVFVVLIIIVVSLVIILRRKPAPAAQQYPGYDQQQLGAYGAQGLPPGYAGELPPQETPELPPAQEGYAQPDNLPPAGGEQPAPAAAPEAPAAAPAAPAAQPEMAQPQPEAPAGNACPSCGSPVDPTWFLCPNCKSPLQ